MRQNGLYIKPRIQCCLEGRKRLSQAQTSSIITRTAQAELIGTGMGPQEKNWLTWVSEK